MLHYTTYTHTSTYTCTGLGRCKMDSYVRFKNLLENFEKSWIGKRKQFIIYGAGTFIIQWWFLLLKQSVKQTFVMRILGYGSHDLFGRRVRSLRHPLSQCSFNNQPPATKVGQRKIKLGTHTKTNKQKAYKAFGQLWVRVWVWVSV